MQIIHVEEVGISRLVINSTRSCCNGYVYGQLIEFHPHTNAYSRQLYAKRLSFSPAKIAIFIFFLELHSVQIDRYMCREFYPALGDQRYGTRVGQMFSALHIISKVPEGLPL